MSQASSQYGSPQSLDAQMDAYNYFVSAAFVILFYDYILTFSDEYDRYWTAKRKISIASVLFYINRYLPLLGHFPVFFLYFRSWPHLDRLKAYVTSSPFPLSQKLTGTLRCAFISTYNKYLIIAIIFEVGVISVLRTYILYSRSRIVLAILLGYGIGSIIYGGITLHLNDLNTVGIVDLPSNGCLMPISQAQTVALAKAWITLLILDAMVFFLTAFKAFKTKKESIVTTSLMTIMLRDGAMYFGIVMLATISVIVSYYVLSPSLRGMPAALQNSLSSTMMSRLMLNLRDPELLGPRRTGSELPISALEFHRQRPATDIFSSTVDATETQCDNDHSVP